MKPKQKKIKAWAYHSNKYGIMSVEIEDKKLLEMCFEKVIKNGTGTIVPCTITYTIPLAANKLKKK